MVKTGEFKEPYPWTTCPDGFLSIHKDIPYPLPIRLVIKEPCNGNVGDLLPEKFMAFTIQTMIKGHSGEGLAHEEQCLFDWAHNCIFKHYDGEAEWIVFPISEIPLAGGDTSCQCLIQINRTCHLCIFKL